MHLSKYTITIKNKNNKYIIFSTITRAVILLGEREYGNLVNCQIENNFSETELTELLRKHIVVDDDLDENNYVDFEANYDRLTTKTFTTYIALSTLCNFSCSYCYEKGQVNKNNRMSREDINELIYWYEKMLVSGNYDRCQVKLYGGEPLLFYSDLKYFLDNLKQVLDKHSLELELEMISNGYLFDTEKAKYLVSMGLREVQITLDGVKEIHDNRRPLINGGGTFNQIIENIKKNINCGVTFVIRISFDLTNKNNIKKLIEYLDEENLHENILIYFAPIHQTSLQKDNKYSFCSKAVINENEEIAKLLIELYELAKSHGYRIPYCYTDGPCMTVSKDSCLIAPDGGLYKCVEMIDNEELRIGNVFLGGYTGRYYDFVCAPVLKECIEKRCIYVLMCGGGCMMQAYMKYDNCFSAMCNKEMLEDINRALLMMNYGNA